jgi:hypothetical protein
MATAEQREAMQLYANIMEEIKLRLEGINHATAGQTGMPFPLVNEFCFLQLRMLCELIALGCLVAHGDIEATRTRKYRTAYAADDIIKMLEALHSDFTRFQLSKLRTKTAFFLMPQRLKNPI